MRSKFKLIFSNLHNVEYSGFVGHTLKKRKIKELSEEFCLKSVCVLTAES
jgi:hypothetical protein